MAIKTPQGSTIDIPRGTRDFAPSQAIAMDEITSVVAEVFRRFGFYPIMTPALELTKVLTAKAYGEGQTKEMYVIEGSESALRFDLTVPLARYMAMNKDTPLPFKRYQIGPVWRKDEPQRMRSREFMQADIDIVGSAEVQSDAECIAASLTAIESLGITNYRLLLSSRPILVSVIGLFKIAQDKSQTAIRLIDKMPKIGASETIAQLKEAGIDGNAAQQLVSFITERMSNEEKLSKVAANAPDSKPEAHRLSALIAALGRYGLKGEIEIDFSLARGLDYYTGAIWEAVVEIEGSRQPTIVAGGRYDNLIGIYSKAPAPAVGSSIGLSRIFDLIEGRALRKSYAAAFIAQIGQENTQYATDAATALRGAGIRVDLNVTTRGISKQLEYASSLGIHYVIIVGNKEREAGKLRVRDMLDGTEALLDMSQTIEKLSK